MTKQHLMTCLALMSILLIHSPAHAGTFTAFDSRTFVRGSGKPVVETASFNIKNPNTIYTIKLYSSGINAEYAKVSSGVIKLNGSTIFDTNDFNQQVSSLQKQVSVSNSNQLQVELRSISGSGLTVFIEGEDSNPPLVAITSPVDGTYIDTPSITLSGTSSDAISWVSTVTVNGTNATLTGENYISSIQLTEGLNNITATATDAAGNTGNSSASVVLDTIPPKITLDPMPSLTNKPQHTIAGKVEDASPISSLTMNGSPVTLTNNIFTATINLTEGNNNIAIAATDKAGNIGKITTSILLDTISPAVTITSPANQTFLNTPSITVTAMASDEGSGISKITVNNTTAQVNGNAYTASIQLTEGQNIIIVTAKDNAGNITVQTVTITIDTTPPAIAITSPANGSTVNTSTIAVIGMIDDSAATVTVNGINANVSNNAFSADISLVQGTNTVNVIATDPVGNTSTAEVSIIYAVQSPVPVITITSPSDGSTVKSTSVLVSGTVNDPAAIVRINGNIVTVIGSGGPTERESPMPGPTFPEEPQMPRGAPAENQTYTFASYVDLVEGINQITVTATNASGKTSSTSITVTRSTQDVPPPVISVSYPSDGSIVTSSFLTLFGFISDPFPTISVSSDTAYIDHNNSYINGNFFYYTVRLVSGQNKITITAINSAGKTSTSSLTVTYSPPGPIINITSPANGSTVNTPQLTISAYVYRTANPIAGVTINGTNAALTQNDYNGYSITSSVPLTQGPNTITVVATDTAGFSSTSSITVYLDSVPPTVTSTTPAFNDVGIHIDSSITVTFSEPMNNITATTFTLSSATTGQISGRIIRSGNTITFTPYNQLNPNTVYTAVIKGGSGGVTDFAGNALATDYAWVFKTGGLPVQVDITEPYNWGTISGTVALIKGSIKSYSSDVSVKANGIVAEINGENWAAAVPLNTGWNAVEVNAFDSSGNTDKKTIYIYAYSNIQLATITSNPKSGIAPLSATFSIGNSSNITSYFKIDFDGDGAIDLETESREGITYTYNLPGLYFPTVTYIYKGYTRKSTTVVNVLSKDEMDTLLKGKWEGMKGAMGSSDTTTALKYFDESVKDKFTRVFSDLGSDLPAITASFEDITLVSFTGDIAEYAIGRNQDGQRYIYFIYFMKDKDGIWKIKGM